MAKANNTVNWREKQVFTTGEAAEICKVSQQTIIRCFDSGRLQGFRVPGSRFRRIQSGLVTNYAALMTISLVLLLVVFVVFGGVVN